MCLIAVVMEMLAVVVAVKGGICLKAFEWSIIRGLKQENSLKTLVPLRPPSIPSPRFLSTPSMCVLRRVSRSANTQDQVQNAGVGGVRRKASTHHNEELKDCNCVMRVCLRSAGVKLLMLSVRSDKLK